MLEIIEIMSTEGPVTLTPLELGNCGASVGEFYNFIKGRHPDWDVERKQMPPGTVQDILNKVRTELVARGMHKNPRIRQLLEQLDNSGEKND